MGSIEFIPFMTHGGSGFSSTICTIQSLEPDATVIKAGFFISRNSVAGAQADVKSWTDSLLADSFSKRKELKFMKSKMIWKICVDIAMTVALLFLMAYELIGENVHEWIGVSMFVLFVLHHILNGQWSSNLLKGKYTPFRIWQTILVCLVLASMIGSMISGIILSKYVFDFLSIRSGQSWARTVHLLCSYWGFVVMSLHLGLHWSMMMGMVKKQLGAPSRFCVWTFRVVAAAIAIYGAFALVHREIGSYMFLKNEFVFFDFEEPLVLFFLDYLAVMGLFVFLGHYFAEFLKYLSRKRKRL